MLRLIKGVEQGVQQVPVLQLGFLDQDDAGLFIPGKLPQALTLGIDNTQGRGLGPRVQVSEQLQLCLDVGLPIDLRVIAAHLPYEVLQALVDLETFQGVEQ